MKSIVFGRQALFCNEGCEDAFREDRVRGLVYGQVLIIGLDGSEKTIDWEEASVELGTCAYCKEIVIDQDDRNGGSPNVEVPRLT